MGDRPMGVQIRLDTMTTEEKLRAAEDIWADLRKHADEIPSSDWHRDVLKTRAKKHTDDSAVFEDWSIVKERVRKTAR